MEEDIITKIYFKNNCDKGIGIKNENYLLMCFFIFNHLTGISQYLIN